MAGLSRVRHRALESPATIRLDATAVLQRRGVSIQLATRRRVTRPPLSWVANQLGVPNLPFPRNPLPLAFLLLILGSVSKQALESPTRGWDRAAIRFLLVFVVLVVVCGMIVRTEWFDWAFLRSYTSFIASLSGGILRSIGVDAKVDQTRILSQTFSVEIRKGCDGLEAALLLLCATVAYPFSSFRTRLLALITGYLLIFVLNLIRVVGLFLIGLNWPGTVEFVHTYIAQFAIITVTMIFWLFWIARDRTGGRPTSAGATPP